MTDIEAVEIIKAARAEVEWEYPIEYAAAFDRAVKALEQEPCEDAISRETVKTEYKHRLESSLKDESREIDLTYLADCTRFNEFIDSIPPVNSLLCEDAISRQAAIDALDKRFDSIPMEQTVEILQLRKDLRELPSAQPERKKSDWIPCSEPPKNEGTYLVYAPGYMGGSSSAKENHNGVMFSNYKNGKWSIGHGYYKRPNCINAWMPLPEPYKAESEDK